MKTNNNLHYNDKLKNTGRSLRSSMTETEVRLWNRIRRKQINKLQFFRQRPIGNFIVDFYCPKMRLVIEIDGGQHFWDKNTKENDFKKNDYLKNKLGLKVLRFSNVEFFNNIEGVIEIIIEKMQKSPLIPL